jgi:hypothetical protein
MYHFGGNPEATTPPLRGPNLDENMTLHRIYRIIMKGVQSTDLVEAG